MKRITVIALFFVSISLTHAQNAQGVFKSPYFQQFLKSTTYAVRTGDSLFDAEVEKSMAKHWKVTPYKIIDEKEFKSSVKNPANSFLVLTSLPIKYRTRTAEITNTRTMLHVIMGCPDYPKLCGGDYINNSLAWGDWNSPVEMDAEEGVLPLYYLVQNQINGMHFCLESVKKDKVDFSNKSILTNNFHAKYFSKGASALKKKTLYIVKAEMESAIDLVKAAKSYLYKFKIVTEEDIVDAIKREDKNVVYMLVRVQYGPAFYDIETHRCIGGINYSSNYGPHLFLQTKDFKDIADFVKNSEGE